jgi:hypothetical protein
MLLILIATMLIALAVVGLVAAGNSLTEANSTGVELSTAEFLIEQIRELTALLPVVDPITKTSTFGPEEAGLASYDDLDDFDVASFSPPINAEKQPLADFAAYSQQIEVENLNPSNFEQVAADHGSDFVRITVKIFLNSRQIESASWIRARY